jgi:hypothetical protein
MPQTQVTIARNMVVKRLAAGDTVEQIVADTELKLDWVRKIEAGFLKSQEAKTPATIVNRVLMLVRRNSHAKVAETMTKETGEEWTSARVSGLVSRSRRRQREAPAGSAKPLALSPAMLHLAQFDSIIAARIHRESDNDQRDA